MKKKTLFIIILVIISLCALAFVIWTITKPQAYEPEYLEPEVYEDQVYDTDMIIGLWQTGSVFYRYNDDYTGVTWDTADDVTELEGGKFTWEVDKKRIIHYHQMEISGAIIPKVYTITNLDLSNLEYRDDYKVEYVFTKVE
jgi:hypothetical protein